MIFTCPSVLVLLQVQEAPHPTNVPTEEGDARHTDRHPGLPASRILQR